MHYDLIYINRGNCLPLESVPILTASSNLGNDVALKNINASVSRHRILEDVHEAHSHDKDDDYDYIPNRYSLSKCSNKIVAYIAGFVVFKLKKSLHCEVCNEALTLRDANFRHSLIKLKTKGRLVYPSDDVIDICNTRKRNMRKYCPATKL